jgi:hypothetical protein
MNYLVVFNKGANGIVLLVKNNFFWTAVKNKFEFEECFLYKGSNQSVLYKKGPKGCKNKLFADRCNNWLLRSISSFSSLTTLELYRGDKDVTSFQEGMLINLTCLRTLGIVKILAHCVPCFTSNCVTILV